MSKRTSAHGLGRGLDALFSQIEQEDEALRNDEPSGEEVKELSLNDIDINSAQPRKSFDEDALKELAESIASVGVIQPIIVHPNGDRYTIVVGERRFRASRLAGKTTIPAIVRSWDEMTRLKSALIENIQRQQLNPIETAQGLKTLMEKCDLTQDETAEAVGKSRSQVTNTLRLLTLEPEVQQLLLDGSLTAGHARALVGLPASTQLTLAREAVKQGLNVRQLEKAAQLGMLPFKVKKPPKSQEIKRMEKMAREAFGVKARVDGDENRGRLVLTYSSREDLEGIWNILEALNQGGM
ncbi:MAG: ParB/RepB/Spo0J family partition protein [Clostridiales bacterium]|nr:ParB/RepB/Spo0J family partition protein [Clostridiales bacterium]